MLNVVTLAEAGEILQSLVKPVKRTELITLEKGVGRVLAADLCSQADVPSFDRAMVDGLAVRGADTFGASDTLPAMLHLAGTVKMGETPDFRLCPGECALVPTGGALPAGADAMVMIEYTENPGDKLWLVQRSVSPGDHIIKRGDDFAAGQVVLPAGRQIRAADIGTLAALAANQILVFEQPRVAIISTGDELLPVSEPIVPGCIHDVNSPALSVLVRQAGALPIFYGIVADQPDELAGILAQAASECDLVLVSGGSSVGEKDYLAAAIAAQGESDLLFHGIAVKPGKPTIAGLAGDRIILGLPGHPLAAWFMTFWLALPLLDALQGTMPAEPETVTAVTSCRIPSNLGRESIIPVKLVPSAESGKQWLAEPVFTKSGLITALSQSDGCIRISRELEGIEAGSQVTVYRFH